MDTYMSISNFTFQNNQTLFLQTLLVFIQDKYFKRERVTLIYGEVNPFLLNIILATLQPAIVCSSTESISTVNSTALILVGNVTWQPIWRPRGKVLILTEQEDYNHVQMWLRQLWQTTRLTDAIVATIGQNIHFYAHFPFAPDSHCGNTITPMEIEVDNLYSEQVSGNLYGCPIRVVSDWVMPYVRNAEMDPRAGAEDNIMSAVVRKLNGRHEEVQLPKGEQGQIHIDDDGNLVGGAKALYHYLADVSYSGYTYRIQFSNYFEFLLPHTIDSMAWYVPSPAIVPGALYLFLAFTRELWLLVLASLVLTVSCLWFVSKSTLMDVVSLTLNLTVSKGIPKLVLMTSYFYSLHITTSYQSSLFMLYSRKVMEPQIKTIEEAADSNLKSYFFEMHKQLLNQSDHQLWNKILRRSDFKPRQHLYNFAFGKDFLFLVQYIPVLYYIDLYNMYDEYGPTMVALRQKFVNYPVIFYMSNGNPLLRYVNSIIQHLVDAGLVEYWLNDLKSKKDSTQNGGFSREGNSSLTFFHLSGAFGLLASGLLLALLSFVAEIVRMKIRGPKKLTMPTEAKNIFGIKPGAPFDEPNNELRKRIPTKSVRDRS